MAQEFTSTNDPNFAFTWLFLNSEATAGLLLVGADIAGDAGGSAGVEGDGGAVGGIEAGVYVLDPAPVNEIMIILRGIFKVLTS